MKKYNTILSAVKALIPNAKTSAIEDVAALMSDYNFDELEAMIPDDVMVINGIGAKYAEKIVAARWDICGRPVLADEYEAEVEVKTPRVQEKQISFNQNYNPAKNPVSEMYNFKTVLRGQSALDEHLIANGFNPEEVLISAIGYIEQSNYGKPSSRETEQLHTWVRWMHNGIPAKGGHKFYAILHGTNAGRKDKVLMVRDDAVDTVKKFVYPEFTEEDHKRIASLFNIEENEAKEFIGYTTEAKGAGYAGLSICGTISLQEYMGIDVDPENVAIVKGYKKIFKDQHVDFVNIENGTVELNKIRDVVEDLFDGQSLFHISDKMLAKYLAGKDDEEKKRILRKIKKAKSFTGRNLETKGLVITAVDFHAVLHKLGVSKVITADGRVMDIDDIVILADESVFKGTIGERGTYQNWDKYCETVHKRGHHYRALITEHADKPHTLPFQQLQSLIGGDLADLDILAGAEAAKLNSYTNKDKAAALVGGEIAKIVKAVPEMHNLPWVQKREQDSYTKLYNQAQGGVLHGITHNCFLGKDPIAQLQHVAWAASDISEELQKQYPNESDYVVGAIPENTIVCAVREDGCEAVMSRNPSTDAQAQCVVNVQKDFGEWSWAIRWSTVAYASVNSYETTRIRGDHDGDHACICFTEAVVRMAKAANKFTGGRLIDWIPPKTEKHVVTENSMKAYFANLTQVSQLGHWCDMLTSLVGFGTQGYNHEVACWLVMAVNVFVDAAKHGMDAIAVPKFVTEFLSIHDEAGNLLVDEEGRTIRRPMPIYAMQAKDNHNTMALNKRVGSDRCAKKMCTKSNGDRLRSHIQKTVPANLTVDLTNVGNFDVNDLMYDYTGARNGGKSFGLRGCDELFEQGKYNKETGCYEGQGLWKELCYVRARELKDMKHRLATAEDDRWAYNAAKKTTEKFHRYIGIQKLTEWAETNGRTIEDVCDAITFYTCYMLKYPVARKNETAEELKKRIAQYNTLFEGWARILGGLVLRAIYMRNHDLAACIAAEDDVTEDYAVDESLAELL